MIDILMATYNGEAYLRSQLDSILRQTNTDWRLIIRDDCSTDATVQIVQEYQAQYPDKFILLQADMPSGSAQNNFFQLIQYWNKNGMAKYVMFADQDDVWLPNKIQMTLVHMQELERLHGVSTPLLVHTDLTVVDAELNIVNHSLFAMHNMDARRNKLNNILVQNIVTGCTVMVNRSLLNMVHTVPKNAVMHDMWLALIAAAFGQIGFIDDATILYRQHGKNVDGAKNMKSINYYKVMLKKTEKIHNGLLKQYQHADSFLNDYGNRLTNKQKEMLVVYGRLEHSNPLQKLNVLTKYRLYKKGIVRKLGQILL